MPCPVNHWAGRFAVNDGNHRLEALRRLGRAHDPAIVWTTEASDAVAFDTWRRERLGA